MSQGPKNKFPVVGTAMLNLAEFASSAEQKEFELSLPLMVSAGAAEARPVLCVCAFEFVPMSISILLVFGMYHMPFLICFPVLEYIILDFSVFHAFPIFTFSYLRLVLTMQISLSLLELRTASETTDSIQRAIVPVPSPLPSGETTVTEKDELSAIKAGLRKVKIFTDYVSTRRVKKAFREEEGSEGRCSARSEDGEYNYPFDSDSLDDFEEGESDEVKEDSSVRKSFSYGTLAYANGAGGSFYSNMKRNDEGEDWVYYSNRKSDVGCSHIDDLTPSVSESSLMQSSKRSLLPWRKRKLSFRSPKAKGEPLLKKAYGEEGGDDIDFDRRQLSSDEALALGVRSHVYFLYCHNLSY